MCGGGDAPATGGQLAAADYGGNSECRAALTSAAFCPTLAPGVLVAGSLDGTVSVWR